MDEQLVVYVDVDDTLIHTSGGKRTALPMTVQLVRKLHGQYVFL